MTIVKELNELAYKMTGVNPKAKTDQQALNYIEQNYNGGDTPTPTSKSFYIINFSQFSDVDNPVEITDTTTIEELNDIKNNYIENPLPIVVCYTYDGSPQYKYTAYPYMVQTIDGTLSSINVYLYNGNDMHIFYDTQTWKHYEN